jgi:pilus assembly protein CpaE
VPAVRVRLVSEDPAWCAERVRALAPVPDILVTASVRLSALESGGEPDGAVSLVDGGSDLGRALEAVAARTRAVPGSACVLVAPAGVDPQTVYPRAALAGVRVVVAANCELPELAEAIYRTADTVSGTGPASGPQAGSGTLIALFGTKGGVGKTTLGVNLAVALARRGLRAAFLDLHFDWGTAGVLLRGSPRRRWTEMLTETAHLDADLLQSFMLQHPSGVSVLPAPPRPEMAEFVTAAHVTAITGAARDGFDCVVADLPPGFPPTIFPALEQSDHLLAVTTPDVPALRNLRAGLRVLEMLQCTHAKIHLVLNRVNQTQGVRRADVETTLGMPVWATLPVDAAALRSGNEGLPVTSLSPGGRYTRSLEAMAQQLVPKVAGRHAALQPPPGRRVLARAAR